MILTIRTDRPEAELGLFDGQKKVTYESWAAHRQLAETIHQKVQKILSGNGKTLEDLSGIVAYKGPGSFTGLRIGVSVANAMAYGLGVPVVSTSGKDWVVRGVQLLLTGKGEKAAVPEYGQAVSITQQKK